LLADSGYGGFQNLHSNSLTPLKPTKLNPLTHVDKKENAALSGIRIKVENALTLVKRFSIFSTRYQNRSRRIG